MPSSYKRLTFEVLGEPEGALVEGVTYWDSKGDNVGPIRAPGDAGWEVSRNGFVSEFAKSEAFSFVNVHFHTSSFLVKRKYVVENVVNAFIVLKKQDGVVCELREFMSGFVDFNALDVRIVSN